MRSVLLFSYTHPPPKKTMTASILSNNEYLSETKMSSDDKIINYTPGLWNGISAIYF